jgi:hypothetical protein
MGYEGRKRSQTGANPFLARSYTKQKLLGDQLAGHGGADGFYIRDNAAGFYFGAGGDLP